MSDFVLLRMCATARLFIDHMLPDVDAGIFLDTDILLMDNIKVHILHTYMLFMPDFKIFLCIVDTLELFQEIFTCTGNINTHM